MDTIFFQQMTLAINLFIIGRSIWLMLKHKDAWMYFLVWGLYGIIGAAYYIRILFFDLPQGHEFSIMRSFIQASIVGGYLLILAGQGRIWTKQF